MHPSLGNQIDRLRFGQFIAEIQLDVMITSHSLISTTTEGVQILFVERRNHVSYILAVVVPRVRDLVRCFDCSDCQFGRWNDKTFIYKNVCAGWMIDHHQTK